MLRCTCIFWLRDWSTRICSVVELMGWLECAHDLYSARVRNRARGVERVERRRPCSDCMVSPDSVFGNRSMFLMILCLRGCDFLLGEFEFKFRLFGEYCEY